MGCKSARLSGLAYFYAWVEVEKKIKKLEDELAKRNSVAGDKE